MSLRKILFLSTLLNVSNAFATGYFVDCSSADQKVSLTRDELKINGKTYRHSATNDIYSLEEIGFKFTVQAVNDKFEPINVKLSIEIEKEIGNASQTKRCADIYDHWTSVSYTLIQGPNPKATKGYFICRTHVVLPIKTPECF